MHDSGVLWRNAYYSRALLRTVRDSDVLWRNAYSSRALLRTVRDSGVLWRTERHNVMCIAIYMLMAYSPIWRQYDSIMCVCFRGAITLLDASVC